MGNVTDALLPDQGPAKRPSRATAPRMAARFVVGGHTDDALRAEHRFSAHCIGRRATHAPAARVREAFTQNSVGARSEFPGTDAWS